MTWSSRSTPVATATAATDGNERHGTEGPDHSRHRRRLGHRAGHRPAPRARRRDARARRPGAARGAPPGAHAERLDVRDDDAVARCVAAVLERHGRIDALVNCAGVGSIGTLPETSLAHWDEVMDVNLRGTMAMCRAALPAMLARRRGAIVNVGSTFGLLARENCVAYSVSKAAVIQLTRCLAIDIADGGVRVNAVCPGFIETAMTSPLLTPEAADLLRRNRQAHAMRRTGQPEEVAEAIAWLVSDRASFVTGIAMPVDGGYTSGKWLGD
ncbi:MAG: SDR family oxidoreductase [Steroidobacteraceae bacterium]